ncbi:Protein of uncharacterised function (DUF3644) [Serratia liquefaciens]|jgi:hypothetical protein|uniref:DUF3644 domain-containing protein n=1 Tax=Serratia liquefaciens TaxID=614 RepID=UPI0021778A63|nr:DUF3644 domain-containing protein [Serratia liquefaciens]CAI1208027.1 Protein of uncharacterised function (DUF3644) [Serratia liquefaciens]CAI1214752.1 Protein of uncharacterised function (DUF3644) [Serratia liquefaciens]
MSKFDKVDLAYDFLVSREKIQESFTIEELAAATGWKVQTCKTYPTKTWNKFISRDGKQYTTLGVKYISKEDFRYINTQKHMDSIPQSERSVNLKKAREFALLAVATYNNPFTDFKTFGFIVNIIIAYTSLFHAIFARNGMPYSYLEDDGSPKLVDGQEKAWELKTCCQEYWPGIESAEKANLLFLIGLRNVIEHRGLPAIDLLTFGECQAAINNFENIIIKEFGEDNALMINLALAMQLTRATQQAQIDAIKQFQTENFNVVKSFMVDYKNELSDDIVQSQQYRLRALLVPLVGKNAKQSDLAIEFINVSNLSEDEVEKYESGIAFIKNVENQFKLKPTKVVSLVQKKEKSFNITTHTKFWKYYEARPIENDKKFKGKYCGYVEGFDGYLYCQEWVRFILAVYKDKDELKKILAY